MKQNRIQEELDKAKELVSILTIFTKNKKLLNSYKLRDALDTNSVWAVLDEIYNNIDKKTEIKLIASLLKLRGYETINVKEARKIVKLEITKTLTPKTKLSIDNRLLEDIDERMKSYKLDTIQTDVKNNIGYLTIILSESRGY